MLLFLIYMTYASDDQLKVAGGTVHFLECAKRWTRNCNLKIITLTTPLGARLLAKHGFNSHFILTNAMCEGRTDTLSTIISWVGRCLSTRRIQEYSSYEEIAIVTESHFLP